ncbi:helix-turn-helix domain-containing protein [Paenibacillus tianjinensis]|uniref:Uncharacterized protein n=1 Tax=Paenibacillus tianjinensis TaxID=2810347 RepID=A0ABX7LA07_9BACL|nr:hypothetical protein [Paenibacillus tianjinensis]QSF43574.1 hypothetical protein JRJ22_20140 [Paenibacillus tianjinensis]
MSEIKQQIENINNEFIEMVGGSFVRVDTGELFTLAEVKKYIAKKVDILIHKNLDETKRVAFETLGVSTEQTLIKKRSKIKPISNRSKYDGGEFNMAYRSGIERVFDMKLEINEKLVYYVLRDFISYPSNCIMINGQIPTMIELESIIGLKERTIRKALKSLEDKNLIKLVQSSHRKAIYVNPEYYASGKDLLTETLKMFELLECDYEKIEEYINE